MPILTRALMGRGSSSGGGGGGGSGPFELSFTSATNTPTASWVGSVLTVVHGLNRVAPVLAVYDNTSAPIGPRMDKIDNNTIEIEFGARAPIAGTWSLSVP